MKAFKNAAGGLTSIVGIGTSSGFNLGIQTAAYDNNTGIITVTIKYCSWIWFRETQYSQT